ncbi:BCCT family transporter [Denitromonas sp.]|uniref:BCCT family transporter n=1 Tax=Denitromonas sp. TaxID=2734609 RepID=UPI003A83B783
MRDISSSLPLPGDTNARLFGLDFHKVIFPISVILIVATVATALNDPAAFGASLEATKGWILKHFDWFIMIMGNLFVLLCIGLAVSPLGKIRMGGADARPEFGLLSWFSMLFAAGMGVGLLYWGVAEPVAAYTAWWKTPFNVAANTPEAVHAAMGSTLFHWGLHPWAIYLTTALIVGYFSYNKGLPFSLSSALKPLIGDAYKGPVGHCVDVFTVVLTTFGLATSLGLGAMQATAGIHHVLGTPNNFLMQAVFILSVCGIAAISVWRGMDAGVKLLSNINMGLALLLVIFAILGVGVAVFLSGMISTSADYVSMFLPLANWVDRPDRDWFQGWTVFYWAWWCTWGPLVGVFVAKVSKGRTIRQMVTVVMLVPTIVAIVWFTAFGGGAIAQVAAGSGALADGLKDVNMAIFQFLEVLPMSAITSLLVVFLLVIFMVTSVGSGALVVDNLAAGGIPDTPVPQRVLWVGLIALVTMVLFVIGGDSALKGVQAGAVAMGLPFMALMLVLMIGFVKALIEDARS